GAERPMNAIPKTLEWIGEIPGRLVVLDQRALPDEERRIECRSPADVFDAIRSLAVRGAPAIGVAAAYRVGLGVQARRRADEVADHLVAARPTAVTLAWACDRMKRVAAGMPHDAAPRLLAEARAIEAEDREMCRRIGEHGAKLLRQGASVLTHCNAGAL